MKFGEKMTMALKLGQKMNQFHTLGEKMKKAAKTPHDLQQFIHEEIEKKYNSPLEKR
jgi:hypothetical protein